MGISWTVNAHLLFRAFGFGILGKQWRVEGFQGFAFSAEESLRSLFQSPVQHTDTQPISSPTCKTSCLLASNYNQAFQTFIEIKFKDFKTNFQDPPMYNFRLGSKQITLRFVQVF